MAFTGWRVAARLANNRRGAAVVEFAIVAFLLIGLVFGIIDFGLLMKDYLGINQAAREGVRSASIGDTTTAVTQRVITSAPTTTLTTGNIVLDKSVSGTGGWVALGNSGSMNNAAPGDYVRVSITIQHAWLTRFFSTTPQTIHAYSVARRE